MEYQLLLGLVLLALCTQNAQGTVENQVQALGTRCKDNEPICPSSTSYCDDRKKCVCNSGFGRGHFACHKPTHEYCHVINDPVAYTFGHEHFELPLPCRWLAASVNAKNWYNGYKVLDCNTKVFAYNVRSLGKTYVGGLDVCVDYTDSTNQPQELHFRAHGRVDSNGEYHFQLSMRNSLSEFTPFSGLNLQSVNGGSLGEVKFEVDDDTKRVVLLIEHCGLEASFRPAHPDKGMNQDLMPGLAIAYDKTYDLRWLDLDKVMCLHPDLTVTSTGKVAENAEMSPSHAFLWRGVRTAPHQAIDEVTPGDDPGFNSICPSVTNTMKECSNVDMHIEAMEMCHFILSYPLFLKCYSRKYGEVTTSAAAFTLFGQCVSAFCNQNNHQCARVHDLISSAGCRDLSYDAFKEHGCHF